MPSPSSLSLNFLSLRSLVTILSLSAIVVAHPLWTLPRIYGETLVRRNGDLEKYLTDCEKPTSTCFSEHQYRSPQLRTFHTDVKAYQTNQELQTTPAELTKYAEAYLKFLGKNTERDFIVAAVHKQGTVRVYLHSIPRESGYIAQLKVETPTVLKGYMSDYLTAKEAPYDIWHHAETAALTKALRGNGDADKTRDKYTDQYVLGIAGLNDKGGIATICDKCLQVLEKMYVVHARMGHVPGAKVQAEQKARWEAQKAAAGQVGRR